MVTWVANLCHWACYEFGSANTWVWVPFEQVHAAMHSPSVEFGRELVYISRYQEHVGSNQLSSHHLRLPRPSLPAILPTFAPSLFQLWFGPGRGAGNTARLSSRAQCHRPPSFPSKLHSCLTFPIPCQSTFLLHSLLPPPKISYECIRSLFIFYHVVYNCSTLTMVCQLHGLASSKSIVHTEVWYISRTEP